MTMCNFPSLSSTRLHPLSACLLVIAAVLLDGFRNDLLSQEWTVAPLFIAGGRGNDPGEFGIPESVVLDHAGRIAVTDKGRMMVHVYSSTEGRALFSVGGLGSDLGKLDRPNGIAVDSQGRILVVEQRNYRIQVFDADYNTLFSFGTRGAAAGAFQKPMGIAVDSQDRIYVTDESRQDVQVFDQDGSFLWTFADGDPRLKQVESIEIDEALGRIYVCDESRSQVNIYDLQGNHLTSFGEQGSGPGQFGNDPNAVRVDGAQRIWINDQGNQRINVYGPDLDFVASFRNAANGMESADGMELSEERNLLLVADQGNDRVLAFDLMQLQAIVAWQQLGAAATHVDALELHADADGTVRQDPLWEGSTVFLQARGQGDPQRIDVAVARVASGQDRRGHLVFLTETGLDSGIFRGAVALSNSLGPSPSHLVTAAGDTVRAHAAGQTWSLHAPVLPLPPPEVRDLGAGPGDPAALPQESQLTWTFHDPAQQRSQEAVEISLLHPDGTVTWTSGEVPRGDTTWTLTGEELPAATPRRVRVRVRTGGLWSEAAEMALQRNTPPSLPAHVSPQPHSVLHAWPPSLWAHGSADVEGHPLTVQFEIRAPRVRAQISPMLPVDAIDGVRWDPGGYNVMENESLQWRVLVHDGIDTTVGPWWFTARDEVDESADLPAGLAPRGSAWVFDEDVVFTWNPVVDPDPGQDAALAFEWRDPNTRPWNRQPTTSHLQHLWPGTTEDGVVHWRLVLLGPGGAETLTRIQTVRLERQWSVTLEARTAQRASTPLRLGVRRGARDETVAGEDILAPDADATPQILSLGPDIATGKQPAADHRLVDLRRPRPPSSHPNGMVFDILIRAEPRRRLALHLTASDLPEPLHLVWHDAAGVEVGPLETGGPLLLHTNDLGECRGRVRVHVRTKEIEQPGEERLPPEVTPSLSRADSAEATGRDAGRVSVLQRHVAMLANPLAPGARLVPTISAERITLGIFDVRGRRVHMQRGQAREVLAADVFGAAGLPTGVYLLRWSNGRETSRRKMVWCGPGG